MIPPDAATLLRLTVPDQPLPTQPIPATQRIADALREFVPGQRLMAQIQASLPNGTYRAVVGQREITLALPFSAKAGDMLKLEVTENKGKVSLAFVANRGDGKTADAAATQQSVPTRLSQTGQLIGDLLTGIGKEGSRAQPATLNGSQPLVAKMPENAAELVPLLKEALAKSGMFYEANQARWIEGKLTTAALLEQPQGKLSPVLQEAQPQRAETPAPATSPASAPTAKAAEEAAARIPLPAAAEAAASARATPSPVHALLVPLVQQQLDALATQTYVWQGQAWPGQEIHWEISEDGRRQSGDDDVPERWQTRMTLRLPTLGGIEASIRLRAGNAVDISLTTDSEASRNKLTAASRELGRQLDAAGLALTACTVNHGENSG